MPPSFDCNRVLFCFRGHSRHIFLGRSNLGRPSQNRLRLLFSGVICLPSLYIFTCMGGLDAKFSTVSGMLCALIALSGLLLVGFAPVVWLFSVSSTSATFLGVLLIVLWLICACFGLSLVFRSGHALGMTNTGHFAFWCLIFLLVTPPNDDNPSPHHRQRRKTGQLRGKEILSELLVRASDAGTLRLGFLHIQ